MTTNTPGTWIKFDGSDAQIAEIFAAKSGYLYRNSRGYESGICKNSLGNTGLIFISKEDQKNEFNNDEVTHYLIIPDDPLREMKIRHAMTGQPVYIMSPYTEGLKGLGMVGHLNKGGKGYYLYLTNTPDWNIPGAEYSFKPFEES